MAESFLSQLRNDPATKTLLSNVGKFAGAQVSSRLGGGAKGGAAEQVISDKAEGKKGGVFSAIKGAVKGIFGGGGGSKRPTNIYEQNLIGVPVEVAYREWKRYAEFPKFMKGPESVSEQDEDGKTKWTAKIFLNRRSWTATVTEDIENYKIKWETEAPKGTIDGTITFNPLGDNLTAMVYVLEYRPKGFFEWIGNRNRIVGRRARLDAKHFVRYVMMQDAETGEETEDEESETDEQPINEGEETDVQPEDQQPTEDGAASE